MFSVTGILLAGGQSRRMGKDKALLPLPGQEKQRTFVAHLTSLLTSLCSEVVLVARDASQAASFAGIGARVVTDSVPGGGPLVGLYSGLNAAQYSHALVVAVDMPFVQPDLVTLLLSQPLNDALLVPVVGDVPQVLLAVYPRVLLPVIEERLRAGRRDPRSLLDVAPVHYLPEEQLRAVDPELRSFINLNTPAELSAHVFPDTSVDASGME